MQSQADPLAQNKKKTYEMDMLRQDKTLAHLSDQELIEIIETLDQISLILVEIYKSEPHRDEKDQPDSSESKFR